MSVLTETRNLIMDLSGPAREEREELYPKFERRAVKLSRDADQTVKGPKSPGKLLRRALESGLTLHGLEQALKMFFWRYGNAVRAEVVAELQAAGNHRAADLFNRAWRSVLLVGTRS